MDETVKSIYEGAELECRESLVRHISILEKLTRTASYFPQIIPEKKDSETNRNEDKGKKLREAKERREKIILYLKNNPGSTVKRIAQELDLSMMTVGTILGKMEKRLYDEITIYNGKITREYSLM